MAKRLDPSGFIPGHRGQAMPATRAGRRFFRASLARAPSCCGHSEGAPLDGRRSKRLTPGFGAWLFRLARGQAPGTNFFRNGAQKYQIWFFTREAAQDAIGQLLAECFRSVV
jgi:hypothetical protein